MFRHLSLNHTHLEYLESRFLTLTKAKSLSKAGGGVGGATLSFFPVSKASHPWILFETTLFKLGS